MLIMRGTDESVAKMMETPFEQMLGTGGQLSDRAGIGDRGGQRVQGPGVVDAAVRAMSVVVQLVLA